MEGNRMGTTIYIVSRITYRDENENETANFAACLSMDDAKRYIREHSACLKKQYKEALESEPIKESDHMDDDGWYYYRLAFSKPKKGNYASLYPRYFEYCVEPMGLTLYLDKMKGVGSDVQSD